MRLSCLTATAATVVLLSAPVRADDYYFITTTARLTAGGGEGGENVYPAWRWRTPAVDPRVALDGDGEAYVCSSNQLWQGIAADKLAQWQANVDLPAEMNVVAIRSSTPRVRGKLIVPSALASGNKPISFTLDSGTTTGADRDTFLLAKRAHYIRLWSADIPGAAWFRHQVRVVEQQLGDDQFQDVFVQRRFFGRRRESALEMTYSLMSGGRAISENLQLDRELPEIANQANSSTGNVALDSIEGITIREFDWKPLVKDIAFDADPLATLIPADQHAVFFPNFNALVRFADDTTEAGTPILRFGEPRAENARTRERYEQQLGLSLNEGARLFGPALIRSIAITGGDLYLRTGSDIAVIFEAANTPALLAAIQGQINVSVANVPGVAAVQGEQHGVTFQGFITPDRRVSSYIAAVDKAVVVTNSLVQLERIALTAQDSQTSLAALDEYKFFRHRYPRGEQGETALAILSDPTIRRWCGPKWRIATSRRTRATAVMAELQAEYLHQLVSNQVQEKPIESPFGISDEKNFLLDSQGLRSEKYGNLDFQTPINELEFTHVTPGEAQQYQRWRDGYQRNWSNFFDPIAIRFGLHEDKLEADVTVMPLINGSQYNWLMDVSKGAKLDAASGDPHNEALLYFSFAFNRDSATSRSVLNLSNIIGAQASSWIGNSITVYLDDDPLWKEFAQWRKENPDWDIEDEFVERVLHRLPLALHVDVTNGFRLAAFLTALRTFIEQSAPGMTVWEVRTYNDEPYVRISPSERARTEVPADVSDEFAIYYVASGEGLTVTLNEDLLKRAIDRRIAQRKAAKDSSDVAATTNRPHLGDNAVLRVDRRVVDVASELSDNEYQRAMQQLCWNNLPILNEWKRQFPDHDPVQLHEQHWGIRLVCPAGGEYRWNEEAATMESTIYGHPSAPHKGPALPSAFQDITRGDFGLSFEEHGIRARVELTRGKASPKE